MVIGITSARSSSTLNQRPRPYDLHIQSTAFEEFEGFRLTSERNRARLERDQDTPSTTSTTTWLLVRDREARSHSSPGPQMMPVSR